MPLRLRTSTVRRKGKTYRYYQLSRAVRKDGKPTHEIVAHLGQLKDGEADAIRTALDELAPRNSARQAETNELLVEFRDVMGRNALRYLDVLVVHRQWQRWGLDEFFAQQLPCGRSHIAAADVVESLVVNRCLAPCSKLRATEWIPRTVLPQLLGFEPKQLNNTRIHRVLDALEGIEPELSRFLISHPVRRQQVDSVVFLDITDTWFEGHKAELAAAGKCKDGAIRRTRVQLALGVDAQGLPLRWELLPGNAAEVEQLSVWIEALSEHRELDELPLVFDRGFTSADNLCALVQANRRFVTCAKRAQLMDWGSEIDFDRIICTPAGQKPTAEQLRAAGLCAVEHDEELFYVDQGVRPPHKMPQVPDPGVRTVLFFRRQQYAEQTAAIERKRSKLLEAVAEWNQEMANARRTRNEHKTRSKVDNLLKRYGFKFDYNVQLEPIEVTHNGRVYKSFQIGLEPIEQGRRHRDCNAGWMVLLAHPDDARPAVELIRQYANKEAVEYAFKVIKSFVELRPIRHQKTDKIRAHVTLCILALLLDKSLQNQLRAAGITDEVDRVYETLEPCRLQVLSHRGSGATRWTISETDERSRLLKLLKPLGLESLLDETTLAELGSP